MKKKKIKKNNIKYQNKLENRKILMILYLGIDDDDDDTMWLVFLFKCLLNCQIFLLMINL